MIGWPPSLMTWDVLFLMPVPWLAPVLAPLIVSACLVVGSLYLLRLHARGTAPRLRWPVWAAAGAGAALILLSFTLDHGFVAERSEPPAFRWWLFALGLGVALAALGVWRIRKHIDYIS